MVSKRATPLVWLLVLAGCASQDPARRAEAELLRLQTLQRRAHLEKDADLLTSTFADDFVSVADGVISRPTREESRERFQTYFDSVEFLAWDDISPPVVHVSTDGSVGHVLVHKRVHLRNPASGRESESEFAWLETYRRDNGEWRLTMVVSTQRPAEAASDTPQARP